MIKLFTDSDCDMTPDICAKYGYKLISMPYSVDGKLVRPYVDFEEFYCWRIKEEHRIDASEWPI